MNHTLIYDQPSSQGVENALRRAQLLVETRWTPVQEIALRTAKGTNGFYYPTRSGSKPGAPAEYPIPYSSSRAHHNLVGVDVSLDTFLTAVRNPASIVYTHCLHDFDDDFYNCTITNASFAYGTVCSAFANFTLDLPIHRCTHEWGGSPEFWEIREHNADALALCDTLVTTKPNGHTAGHVRVVTGIGRDPQRHARMIQISEGVTATPRARWYTAEELNKSFMKNGGRERIFRYRYLDSVSAPAPLLASESDELMLSYGDLSNYHFGDPVEFNINCDAETLVIESAQSRFEVALSALEPTVIHGNAYKIYSTAELAPGRYSAYCVVGERKTLSVHFNVVRLPEVRLTHIDGTSFERVALRPVSPDGTPLTKDSPCLYNEDGSLKTSAIVIAMTDGKNRVSARIAVRERNGELIARPAATLTDADGNRVRIFRVGSDTVLYALRIADHTPVRAAFSAYELCEPSFFTWTEEAVIGYQQRLISSDELLDGFTDTVADSYLNAFTNFTITCVNDFGRVTTAPITFVII